MQKELPPIQQRPFRFKPTPREYKVVALRECRMPHEMTHCETPEVPSEYWRLHIASDPHFDPEVEYLVVLLLNVRRRIKGHCIVGQGCFNAVLFHPVSVFRPAVVASAPAIILMHNHPSGMSEPSNEDVEMTEQLAAAGKHLKIELLDHVIMGNREFTSLHAAGWLDGRRPESPRTRIRRQRRAAAMAKLDARDCQQLELL
jgi:hypothetical protein